jgi:hypothetical protein
MNLLATKIQTCMACTSPVNTTTTNVTPPMGNNMVLAYKDNEFIIHYNDEYYNIFIDEDDKTDYFTPSPYVKTYKPKYLKSKSKPFSRSSKKQRNYHNIHQPGRTNCTQRYQRK